LTSSGEHAVPGRRGSRPFFAMLRIALAELDIVHELVLTKWHLVGGKIFSLANDIRTHDQCRPRVLSSEISGSKMLAPSGGV